MPKFGKKSTSILETLHPQLQELCKVVIQRVDFSLISGYRDKEMQNALVRSGKSQLNWPHSKHNQNPSEAFDFIPYPFMGWNNTDDFVYRAGIFIATSWPFGIQLRWGGDWDKDNTLANNNFNDLGHIELVKE